MDSSYLDSLVNNKANLNLSTGDGTIDGFDSQDVSLLYLFRIMRKNYLLHDSNLYHYQGEDTNGCPSIVGAV